MTLDLRSLAAFRIAIGAVVCADALLRTRDFGLMFGSDGMFPPDVLRRHLGDAWSWSLGLLLDADWWNAAVLALEGIAGAALALGIGTRLATFVAWVAVVSVMRRTLPASNAGDPLLACLLLWGMFLPLGAVWSVDAERRRDCDLPPEPASRLASSALVLQIAAVYLSAGLAKLNDTWLSGDAVSYALSLHDHGSYLGSRLAALTPLTRIMTWGAVATEILGPCLLLAARKPRVRSAVAAVFIGFHAAVAALMSVGLFAAVGIAAWLAILPGECWDRATQLMPRGMNISRQSASGHRRALTQRPLTHAICAVVLSIAAAAFIHANTSWRERPLPAPLQAAVRLLCLEQDWAMFGDVPRQQQWVYGRAELADGRLVDLLRGGRPLETTLPAGGFMSLPHHRWQKIFWELPKPTERIFSPGIASALARDWNRRHAEGERVRSLEIRFVRMTSDPVPGTIHELLLATWPPRDASGRGSLDRWLDQRSVK
jgi:uncharacterized membrane protein YphA (DoxX/SURF4 family)